MKQLVIAIMATTLILTVYAGTRGCPAEEFWAVREMRLLLWVMLTPVALHCGMRLTFWLAGLGSNGHSEKQLTITSKQNHIRKGT